MDQPRPSDQDTQSRPEGPLAIQHPQQLTNEVIETLGLVLPVNTQEIDGHSCQHDGQASTTHHGFRPQAKDQQEGPEQQVDDGEQQVDLWSRSAISCVDAMGPRIRVSSFFSTYREASLRAKGRLHSALWLPHPYA